MIKFNKIHVLIHITRAVTLGACITYMFDVNTAKQH